jgi:molybdate transport system substrate-binding protein
MTNGAFAAAHQELAVGFDRTTGQKIVTAATTTGSGSASVPNRVRRGDAVDVVILDDGLFRTLVETGHIIPDSRRVIAGARIGAAVRAGTPKPDIGSVAALKRALMEAKSVAYSAGPSGMYLSEDLFPRLGIAAQMKAKSVRVEGERVGAVIARGEAELGFQQISELLDLSGIDYVGPLPPEVQRVTVIVAGIVSGTKRPDAARAYIAYLASAQAAPALKKHGLDAPPER